MELRFLGFDSQESDLPWPPTSTLRILPLRSRARRLSNIFLPPTTHCWVPSWIPCRSECPLCERPSRFVSFPSSFLLTAASPRLLPFLPASFDSTTQRGETPRFKFESSLESTVVSTWFNLRDSLTHISFLAWKRNIEKSLIFLGIFLQRYNFITRL